MNYDPKQMSRLDGLTPDEKDEFLKVLTLYDDWVKALHDAAQNSESFDNENFWLQQKSKLRNIEHLTEKQMAFETLRDVEPTLALPTGQAWVKISNGYQARAASILTKTSAYHLYAQNRIFRRPDIKWFVLFDQDNPEEAAPVLVAAQKKDAFDADQWPHASHVTGSQDKNAFLNFSDEIEALAEAENLVIQPNHIDQTLAQEEDAFSPGM